MSVHTTIMGGIISTVISYFILEFYYPELNGLVLGAVMFIVFFIGVAVWVYSPLPNHNGGFGMPPAKIQKWGLTSEPKYQDYEDPTTEEVLSPAVPSGWSFATRKEEKHNEE